MHCLIRAMCEESCPVLCITRCHVTHIHETFASGIEVIISMDANQMLLHVIAILFKRIRMSDVSRVSP
jgi:formate hydrogenlyase subunit 6/NADH:ubiquinone oxidoreductase subunit I